MAGTPHPDALPNWLAQHLEDVAVVRRPARSSEPQAGGFDAADFQAENAVLSVHFSDGSVLHTPPQAWLAQVRAAGTAQDETRSAASGDGAPDLAGRIELPFDLVPSRPLPTRGGSTAESAPIDRYTLARLTEPTTLDKVYQVGAWLADGVDGWFGSQPQAGAAVVGAKLCRAFENSQLHPDLGERDGMLLRYLNGQWVPQTSPLPVQELAKGMVLFLHGTASSTVGSFGKLSRHEDPAKDPGAAANTPPPADFAALAQQRLLLAWEHRSLTASPLKNALDLAQALQAVLPAPAAANRPAPTLHLVSHSRGGMVGELISLALLDAAGHAAYRQQFDFFFPAGQAHPDHRLVPAFFDALGQLPRLTAGTFVRVACPARGTLLADRRTDLFLSLLLRCVGLALGSNGHPTYERFNSLVRALVAARADANAIPGLEAMIPGRPLTLVLNTARQAPAFDQDVPVLPGALRVIAGDAVASGWSGLLTLAGDAFYGLHDHDLVVHTHAMFGGFPRRSPLSLRLEAKGVHHLAYFHREAPSRAPLFNALAGRDDDFRPLDEDESRTRGPWQALDPNPLCGRPAAYWQEQLKQPDAAKKPVLLLLPGIMGSELALTGAGGANVWLSAGAVLSGRLAQLAADANPQLQPSGLVALSYERLVEAAVRAGWRVLPFPYDWRCSIAEAGERLRAELQTLLAWLDQARQPVAVHLLAHSMGGLVARAALFAHEGPTLPGVTQDGGRLWDQLQARGGRLLMLGTPNQGSYAPVRLLAQQHSLSRLLATLARKVSAEDMAQWGGDFVGLLQMLPTSDPAFGDLFAHASWMALAREDRFVRPPRLAPLVQAETFRAWRDATFAALRTRPNVFYVAGSGLTPCRLLKPAAAGARLRFVQSTEGDGTVPWTSRLAPAHTWYLDAEHGDLADVKDAFGAYFELLTKGDTQGLSRTPPQSWRHEGGAAERLEPPPTLLPSLPADFSGYVLGVGQRSTQAPPPPLAVSVVHGSLDYARFPLVVGHYVNDSLAGGTRRVDEKLSGQLQHMLDLKLFIGAERTAVYLRPSPPDGSRPPYPGALVVGLGQIGDLTPASLTASITRSVLRFAVEHLYRDPWVAPEGPIALRLSSLLVGTHMQAIAPRESLASVLMGIWHANQHLAKADLGRSVRVAEVEIIEISEYAALDAAYELDRLLQNPDWQRRVQWPQRTLETRSGGLTGYRRRDVDGTWQRLMVRRQPEGGLKFELIAERARVEATHVRSDLSRFADLIQRFADQGALAGTPGQQEERRLGTVLFQLLLPQNLKSRMANFEHTVLVLDDDAAAYPWELMIPHEDDSTTADGPQPLAVQAGMLRQRVTNEFRSLPTLTGNFDALVIGNPSTANWTDASGTPRLFPDLKGAEQEAEMVHQRLREDTRPWRTTALIGPQVTADQVFMTLLARPYRLLHLSAHGAVNIWTRPAERGSDAAPRLETGVLLSDQVVLSAWDVEQMGSVPEFVFINCCYSGRDARATEKAPGLAQAPKLASSLALKFIEMGTKAVVAAGWQVEDRAALLFARSLYRELLLNDRSFGEAVRMARSAVHESGTGGNTWGAYQCYGDPAWRFTPAGRAQPGDPAADDASTASTAEAAAAGATRPGGRHLPVGGSSHLRDAVGCMSAPELAVRLLQVTAVAGDKPRAVLHAQLMDILEQLRSDAVRHHWLEDSQVRAALGQAFRELGDYPAAAHWFEQGARQAYSRVTLRDLEMTVNSLSRVGTDQSHQQAQALLDGLDQLDSRGLPVTPASPRQPTNAASERACLRGSALLRQVRVPVAAGQGQPESDEAAAQRAHLLTSAANHYMRGYLGKLRCGDSPERRAYALSNALLAAGLAVLCGASLAAVRGPLLVKANEMPEGEPRTDWERQTRELLEEIHAQALSTSFWHYTNVFELITARALLRCALREPGYDIDDLKADLAEASQRLDTALVRWPSPSEKDSITERYLLIRELCTTPSPRKRRVVSKDKLAALVAHADYALRELARRN